MQPTQQALLFLTQTLFDLYAFVVLARLLMQCCHVSYHHPVAQFTIRLTEPVIKPLRRFIPRTRLFDIPSILLFVVTLVLKFSLLALIALGVFLPFVALCRLVIADGLHTLLQFYFYGIIILAIASWFAGARSHPILGVLQQLMEPLLRPVRNLLPPMGGIDLSPLLVLLFIKAVDIIAQGQLM